MIPQVFPGNTEQLWFWLYATAMELKAEGKIRHFGISFHDTADVLERILTEHPEIELVQIQFNYADYEDPAVQSKACYEVCRKYGKPMAVMEPVKGGASLTCRHRPRIYLTASTGEAMPATQSALPPALRAS